MEKKFAPDFICKIQDKINKYLSEKYANIKKNTYTEVQRQEYLEKLDQCLIEESDWKQCCFLLPNGKQKRLLFDLSGLSLPLIEEYPLLEHIKIEHKNIIYKGFDLDDIIKAGCVRIGYVEWQSELYICFSCDRTPPKILFDILEEALYQVKTIYISQYDNEKYDIFSLQNGDTIKDIKTSIYKMVNK